jgi:hypothetical protein
VLRAMPPGYDGLAPGDPVPRFRMYWPSSAGAAFASAADLARLGAALTSRDGWRALFAARDSRDTMLAAIHPYPDGVTGYGFSWESTTFGPRGSRLVTKDGAVPGFLSQLGLVPQQLWSLNFAVNYASVRQIETFNTIYALAADLLEPAFAAAFARAVPPPPPAPEPGLTDRLLGSYSVFSSPVVNVTLDVVVAADGSLQASFDSAMVLLVQYAQDAVSASFSLHQLPSAAQAPSCIVDMLNAFDGSVATFMLPPTGHATALQFGDPYSMEPYPFIGV